MKAINCIEYARSYYLLSNDKLSKPFLVGNRIKLEFALEKIKSDMIIATSGNKKRCVILIDYSTDETWALAQRANIKVLKIKEKN